MMNNHSEAEKTEITRIARAMMPPRESDWTDAELTAFYMMASAAFGTMKEQSERKIAEAVGAERERLVSEIVGRIDRFKVTRNPDDLLQDSACKAIVEAIRSAAK